MIDILARAACFAAVILLGAALRRAGFFRREDFHLLSRIVINITLPAAIITNLSGKELELSLLLIILAGFLYGVILMAAAWFLNRRRGSEAQAFAVLNSTGVNISNFVLPFAQTFLGPAGVMTISLFDVGNGMTCLGGSYSVAEMIREKRKGFSFRPILLTMVKSVPLVTYLVMFLLAVLHIRLPGPVLNLAEIIGGANAFLAMLMLGIGARIDAERIREVMRILGPRYAIGLVLGVLSFFLLPVPEAYRRAMLIPFLGPVVSAAPAFTARMKGDYELASAVNSFSIVVSTVLIIAALMITNG